MEDNANRNFKPTFDGWAWLAAGQPGRAGAGRACPGFYRRWPSSAQAVGAGCGAGAGICYLYGGRAYEISHVIVNAVAINSGVVCDGAKASCAAKIASAVEAGLLGLQMQKNGKQFYGGDGLVEKGVENTIRNIGELAKKGMRETDKTIIQIMTR